MERVTLIQLEEPGDGDRLLSAACSLGADEMRVRRAEWAGLRDRARAVHRVPGGATLMLAPDEPMEELASLLDRESECCAFYTFELTIAGPTRELVITAGAGREAAVDALLNLGGDS